jgi:PAS domain S-box-containing protein
MKQVRVLYIEDNEDDALLTLRELEKNSFQVAYYRVENAGQMKEALSGGEWDIIFADYTVPGFGALPALKILRDSGFDIPFIIITGTIDEETAVSAMKGGADDYIMKDRLGRLVPSVERSLAEFATRREHKRAQKEAGAANAKLAAIVEMIPDIFSIIDLNGRIQMVNSSFDKFTGKKRSYLVGRSFLESFPLDDAVQFSMDEAQAFSPKTVLRTESVIRKNRKEYYFDTMSVPLPDTGGEITGIVSISRDNTEKKNIELELQNRISQLQKAWEQTVTVLSDVVEAKDAYTAGHQKRVASLSVAIGKELDLSKNQLTATADGGTHPRYRKDTDPR